MSKLNVLSFLCTWILLAKCVLYIYDPLFEERYILVVDYVEIGQEVLEKINIVTVVILHVVRY